MISIQLFNMTYKNRYELEKVRNRQFREMSYITENINTKNVENGQIRNKDDFKSKIHKYPYHQVSPITILKMIKHNNSDYKEQKSLKLYKKYIGKIFNKKDIGNSENLLDLFNDYRTSRKYENEYGEYTTMIMEKLLEIGRILILKMITKEVS